MAVDPLLEQIRSGSFGFADAPSSSEPEIEEEVWTEHVADEVPTVDFLSFTVNNETILLPLSVVSTVLSYSGVTPYISDRKWLLGGFQYGNQIYPLIDLEQCLLGDSIDLEGLVRAKIVLIEHEDRRIGLIMQQLRRSIRIAYDQMAVIGNSGDDEEQMYEAVVQDGDTSMRVLSVPALMKNLGEA